MFILKLLSRFIGYKENKAGGVSSAKLRPSEVACRIATDEEEKRKEEYDRVMSIL